MVFPLAVAEYVTIWQISDCLEAFLVGRPHESLLHVSLHGSEALNIPREPINVFVFRDIVSKQRMSTVLAQA